MDIKQVVENQRNYFLENDGFGFSVKQRMCNLKILKQSILENLDELKKAFLIDYNKTEFDVLATEVGLVLNEINYMVKHLKALSKKKRVSTSLINFPSSGYLYREAYGVVLVVAPWNYPFQLSMMPLVGAIAGGNTVVLKPSNYCPEVSKVIKKILSVFDERYISVVLGGREQNAELFEQKFDFVFFTGGTTVAKVLAEKASRNLTPCVLELGGKSPCIINDDADVDLSAKRIVWGKFLNAGQTCVAPDHIYVHSSLKQKFVDAVIKYIKKFYYEEVINGTSVQIEKMDKSLVNNIDAHTCACACELTKNFPYIINEKHLERLKGLIDPTKLVFGGRNTGRCLEPTVMVDVTWDDAVMGEEIFGPIMPILTFDNLNDLIKEIKQREKPLALYYFGEDSDTANKVIKSLSFGGGCINDTIMHLTEEKLPFGGVGLSGMGSYHGKKSFETFTHEKSVMKKSLAIDLPIRYMPYSNKKIKLVKFFFGVKNINKRRK